MDALEQLQAEYHHKILQLQRRFREEDKAFFEAFKDEIVTAYKTVGRKVSPATQEAYHRLEQSQKARMEKLRQDHASDVLLLWQRVRKENGRVEVN